MTITRLLGSRYGTIAAVSAMIAAVVILSVTADAVVARENPSHAASHLAVALPVAALVYALVRLCPPPRQTRLGRFGRRAAVIGLIGEVLSLVAESVGAFGYGPDGEPSRIGALTSLHNATWIVEFPALLALFIGLLAAVGSLAQHRAPAAA